MEIILLLIGSIFVLIGIAGSIFPALPGPVISYSSLLILYYVAGEDSVSHRILIILGIATLLIIILSNIIPVAGAKLTGASKYGMIGSFLGMIFGLILFPPFGALFGAFLGAIVGEFYLIGRMRESMRAGVGTLFGAIVVSIIQISFTVSLAVYFFIKLYQLI